MKYPKPLYPKDLNGSILIKCPNCKFQLVWISKRAYVSCPFCNLPILRKKVKEYEIK